MDRLSDLQEEVDRRVRAAGGYFKEMTNLARLLEEAGEMAAIYARTRGELRPKEGDETSPEALSAEMGDLLFVLCCLANQAGVSLTSALSDSIAKFLNRDQARHSRLQDDRES